MMIRTTPGWQSQPRKDYSKKDFFFTLEKILAGHWQDSSATCVECKIFTVGRPAAWQRQDSAQDQYHTSSWTGHLRRQAPQWNLPVYSPFPA